MTVKELQIKLLDIENQHAQVLVSVLNVDDAEVLELKNSDRPTVVILAESFDVFQDEREWFTRKDSWLRAVGKEQRGTND